jgi:hypothetical protein
MPFSLPARRRRSAHRASSCKEMQANPRKKAFISFHFLCRIGAFQWVTANPNKNFPFSISGFANVSIDHLTRPSAALQKRVVPDRRQAICIAQILNFEKESLRRVRLQPADRETNSGTGGLTPRSDAGPFRSILGGIGEPERAAPGRQKAPGMRRKSHAACSIHPHFCRFSLA